MAVYQRKTWSMRLQLIDQLLFQHQLQHGDRQHRDQQRQEQHHEQQLKNRIAYAHAHKLFIKY